MLSMPFLCFWLGCGIIVGEIYLASERRHNNIPHAGSYMATVLAGPTFIVIAIVVTILLKIFHRRR